MDMNQYRNFLCHSIPKCKPASGGRVVNCRCFYCPDSRNPNSKHFYISIPQKPGDFSLYYCHKCHAAGVVTYRNLIEWNIYNEKIAIDLINYNKLCSRKSGNFRYLSKEHYVVNNLTTSNTEISNIKLKYINDRIGSHFTFDDLRELKIVLNLNDVLKDNYIQELTRDSNIVNQLDINFLGFLSIDNAFLNMRRVCDEGLVYKSIDKRYINYKLYDKFDTSERFYTIPTQIDVCRPERTKIHVAEGPFDILSVCENVRKREPGIYTSIGGSNYKGIAMYFLETYKLPYTEFHYYPDNDKYGSTENMHRIAEYLRPLNIPMYLHRNTMPGQKDFGVRPENIQESIALL